MKFLNTETLGHGQMLPIARIGLYRVMDAIVEDCPVYYAAVIRLPFKRWKMLHDTTDQGWAVYRFHIAYHKWSRKLEIGGAWVLVEVADL